MLTMRNGKIVAVIAFMLLCGRSFSQQIDDIESKGKFKRENLFLGTGLNLGLGSRSFNVGVNPEIGYSITRWLDAGVALNFNYFSQNASEFSSLRFRNFNYGGGTFVRLWPISFLYVQVQPEFNWTTVSQKDMSTGVSGTYNANAGSLLVGIGYGTKILGSHYSYFSLMIDVLQNQNSPYRDQYNDPLPVLKAGFGFYLRPARR